MNYEHNSLFTAASSPDIAKYRLGRNVFRKKILEKEVTRISGPVQSYTNLYRFRND